ncbi:BACON domain-containing protein [Candidatus Nomurabacteria bacterium]|nr:BACON domain-containing protein [Candidatus Nomurabacteria bacterium]
MKKAILWFVLFIILAALAGCKGKCSSCGSPTQPQLFTSTYTAEATATATATCPDGTTATAIGYAKITVTMTSNISQADADAKAKQQAEAEAKAAAEAKAKAEVTCGATCTYVATPSSFSFDWQGRSGTITVMKSSQSCPDCTTVPSGIPSWITVTAQGNGSFAYTVTNNNDQVSRTVTFSLCGALVTIYMGPAPSSCSFLVSPVTLDFSCPGGSKVITVTTNRSDCSWFAESNAPWITVNPTTWVSGSGSITVSASANGTSRRTSTITVAGQTVSVAQDACPDTSTPVNGSCAATHYGCTLGTSTNPVDGITQWTWTCLGSNGGSNASCSENKPPQPINGSCAATHYGCTLGVSTNQVDGSTQWTWTCLGSNGGSNASCSENKPAPACTFAVQNTPLSYTWNSTDNSGVVVSTQAGCDWSVSASQSWVTFPEGASGTGPGDFKVRPTQNDGAARNATITFTGEGGYTTTIPVSQGAKPAASCTFAVQNTPVSYTWNPAANTGVVVSTQAGCTWSVSATASWIGVSPTSGTGSGEFLISAAGNSGGARNANVIFIGEGGYTTTIPVSQGAKP